MWILSQPGMKFLTLFSWAWRETITSRRASSSMWQPRCLMETTSMRQRSMGSRMQESSSGSRSSQLFSKYPWIGLTTTSSSIEWPRITRNSNLATSLTLILSSQRSQMIALKLNKTAWVREHLLRKELVWSIGTTSILSSCIEAPLTMVTTTRSSDRTSQMRDGSCSMTLKLPKWQKAMHSNKVQEARTYNLIWRGKLMRIMKDQLHIYHSITKKTQPTPTCWSTFERLREKLSWQTSCLWINRFQGNCRITFRWRKNSEVKLRTTGSVKAATTKKFIFWLKKQYSTSTGKA